MSDISFMDEYNAVCNYDYSAAESNVEYANKFKRKNSSWPPNQDILLPEVCPLISKAFETDGFIDHYLESVGLQCSSLLLVKNHKILLRKDHYLIKNQVKILSGGPAGMDPLLSGFIGPGMLTGAVFGQLSSSPPNADILAALRILSEENKVGIVVIVMNSLADRLNFGLACQQASHEGIKVVCLTVGEDCSGVSISKQMGRRGSSGILFLYKIAGAMAEDNKSLYEIHCVLQALKNKSLVSVNVGVNLNIMTVGSGPKNVPGRSICEITSVFQLVKDSLYFIFNPASYFSINIVKGDSVAIIVNNLGKLYDLYLNLIVREVFYSVKKMGINVMRIYHGRFYTWGNQPSFSISVLKVTDNILQFLDYTVQVSSWPHKNETSTVLLPLKGCCFNFIEQLNTGDSGESPEKTISSTKKMKNLGPRFKDGESYLVIQILQSITTAISDMEEYLNSLDCDMNFGATIKGYMDNITSEIDSKTLVIVSPYGLFNHLSDLAATRVGGVVGSLFCVLFSSAAQAFLSKSLHTPVSWGLWMEAVRMARDRLSTYTRVSSGDGTIMDALYPFAASFNEPTIHCLSTAVEAAMKGADKTASRWPLGLPDPGAIAFAAALNEILPPLHGFLL